jgi:hypothetical protein
MYVLKSCNIILCPLSGDARIQGKEEKGADMLTLYKKPFPYRLPVSPPRKRTKTSSSTPNLKCPSIRTPSLLKKSLSISSRKTRKLTVCRFI